jgi:hypothetical protein
MKKICQLVFVATLLFFAGCASNHSASYVPYVGQQQDWPTSSGAFVSEYDGIQIYRGHPAKPYEVLGRLITSHGSDRNLAWEAKSRGADAVVITDAKMMSGGSVGMPGSSTTYFNGYSANTYSSPSYNIPITRVFITAWLIKFPASSTNQLSK